MANGSSYTLNIKALFDASSVKAGIGEIQNSLKSLKLPDKLTTDLNSSFANVNKALDDFTSRVEKGVKSKTDASGITKSFETVTKELTKLDNLIIKVQGELGKSTDLSQIIKIPDKAKQDIADLDKQIAQLQQRINATNTEKLEKVQKAFDLIKTKGAMEHGQKALELFKSGDIEGAIEVLDKIINKLNYVKQTANVAASQKGLGGMKEAIEEAQAANAKTYDEIGQKAAQQAQIVSNATAEVTGRVNQAAIAFHGMSQGAAQAGQSITDLTARQQQFVSEVDQVKSRIQYFFGLANSINLVKRAIRGAVDTIKELDKAMTETAVVTDYTVKDMWSQLPEYTKRANELGVTTKDAYESATLYFQQGLNADQAAALSTETLKMARIAGLDAAEATDRMTNALRGFNMALDEQSAQRVDDVYSQLAAHTASNVDEISTAMTKVASLAHNANMEFETTAAFLAQIIETTRESAETAGTALKTVVARFSEVKKLVDEGTLRGTDEEGQIIDVNKVGAALRTAGIDLNKYFLGEVGLDDIFIELASKWDTLTAVQQRYIATQAAGSRQQSRFIALMQDYARTQELVGMAYDAEGASEKQFEKTQDSLQSKLARLKNAWNEFLMGITNSGVVKGVVDVLTLVLNIINKITGALGDGVGSVLKFGTAMAALGGARSFFAGGGLGARAIGGLISNGLVGNKIRASLGLGEFVTDKSGNQSYQRYSKEQIKRNRPTFFGTGGLFSTWKEKAQKFKEANLDLRRPTDQYQALSPAEKMRVASTTGVPMGATPKTLFGALGNKFINAKDGKGIGAKLSKGFGAALGKIGIGSGGALGGAATLAATIGSIAAIAGVAAIAIKAMYDASPAGQVKQAEKYADAIKSTATEAQKSAEKFKQVTKNYKQYTDAIEEATSILDRNEAIQQRNDYLTKLLEEDTTYSKYISSSLENGQLVLKLDEASFSTMQEEIEKSSRLMAAASSTAQGNVDVQTIQLYQQRIDDINSRIFYDEATEKDRTDLLYYQNEQAKLQASAESKFSLAARQMLQSSGLEDDLANALADAYAKTFDADEYQKQLRKESGVGAFLGRDFWGWISGSLKQEYEAVYGAGSSEGKKANDMSLALAARKLQTDEEGTVQKLANYIQSDTTGRAAELLKAFNGNVGNKNLLTIDVENEADLYKMFGFDLEEGGEELGQTLIDLADLLGISTDELRDQLKEQARLRKKQQGQQLYKTSAAMSAGGISADNIVKFLGLENADYQQLFSKIYSSFDSSYISDELVNSLLTGIESEDTALTDWLSNIDLSNPIAAFAELSDQAANAEGSIQTVAQQLLQAGNSSQQFSAANQVSFLLLSSGYDSISESLSKFIEQNGTITSTNILELAETSSDLNNILKTGTMTAKGLATALNGIETGTITMLDLSDAVLTALNNMDDLDGMVQKIIDDLNNFDAGFDENDIVGFIDKVLENANENIDKGAYGNNVMANYMQKIFGSFDYNGPSEGYGEAYKAWLKNNVAWLEANKDNMKSAWSDFASTLDNQMLGAAEIYQKDGEIILNANGMTTQQLIDAMTATGKVTKTQAEMMVADFKNYSANFAHEMAENDLPNAIQGWMDALPEINGKKIYDESDITTLAELFGKEEVEIRDIINKLKKDSEEYQGIKWTNEEGERTKENILNAWSEIGTNLKTTPRAYVGSQLEDLGPELFDYDKIKQAYSDLGIPQMFESDFNQILQQGDSFYAKLFGSDTPQKISIKEGQNAGQAYAEAYQQAVNQDLATKIGDAFSQAFEGLELKIDTTEGVASLEVVQKKLDTINNTDPESTVSVNDQASSTLDEIIKKLSQIKSKSITIKASSGGKFDTGIEGGTATGGIIGSYAKGSENFHVKPGTALTGEEGPEIVWNKEKGYSYITGSDGPEFQNLKPGDRVFNASETKKILKNSSVANGGKVGSYAEGYGDAKSPSSNNNNNKDKDKTSAEWKNELDWLYNLMEDIVELERDQKQLEEEFEDILTDDTKTSKDLYNLLIQRLGNLNVQLDRQTFALQKREQEMREFMDTTNDQDKYLWYNWSDRTIEIDWDAIDKIVDGDVYKHVKDLISEAEEIQGKMDDAEDAIQDIENQIQELENIWRDTYVDFEKRVLDALVQSYQDVIDNYSELNNTLNNTNDEILSAIQKEIDLERQIRDNTETEEDISDKEARLAYLQRDTTGANAKEILSLQKELDENRQDYEDSLVDQAIERLQESNDEAAKQRERQIEIMQAQLDYQKENGEFNERVYELMSSALSPDGTLLTTSDLYLLLSKQENWAALSDVNKSIWEEELNSTFKEVGAFLLKQYADWNGEFYTQVAESINAMNEKYKINVGSYSQAKAGGSSGSGSGGGGGSGNSGGSTKSSNEPKDEWIDQGLSPAWDSNATYHWKNRTYYNPKTKKTKTEVAANTKGTHSSTEISRTSTTITYQCRTCGYRWNATNRNSNTSSSTGATSTKGGGGCFAPGTKILMGDNKIKNIEDVQVNDIIMAYDETTNNFVPKRVTESYPHYNTPRMVKITFDNNTNIELTPGHPLYSTKGWKSLDIENSLLEHTTIASLLKIGDIIININGSAIVTNIEYLNIGYNYTSYNLEVEDCHTFLANGFVAHNASRVSKRAYAYATGGLNTRTGPAWLDGTPSEPEYVLNARQTQAFLKLADVLPAAINGSAPISNSYGGDIYLNLDMHVDEIANDYDVDRIANRVKDILYDASSYRNVNTLNFIR